MAETKKTTHEDTTEERVRSAASDMTDIAKKARDEFNRMSLGFFYAGLESLKVAAEMTQSFVSKAYELNAPDTEKRDTVTKRITALPVDIMEASLHALEHSIDKSGKIVDKFYEKYREK